MAPRATGGRGNDIISTQTAMMKDFFISYNRADRVWAEWLAWQLEDAGWSTVIQAWDFRPGSHFVLAMDRAVQEARRLLLVLSPSYLASTFTASEWGTFFARDPAGAQGLLLPVRVAECDVDGPLGQIVYVGLVGLDADAARERRLAVVGEGREQPASSPQYPGVSALTSREGEP